MNPKLGEVGFKAGGKSYVLQMGVNAQCCVEDESGETTQRVIDRILMGLPKEQRPGEPPPPPPLHPVRATDLRVLFWAGLQRHHPDVDLMAAGDLIQLMNKDRSKRAKSPLELILESLRLCAPDADEEEGAGGDPDPRTAAADAGTGTPST